MFSDNDKISGRQIFRLFVFDFVGESTLILPSHLCALCGNDGLFAVAAGAVLGSLYLWYLSAVLRRMGTDLAGYMQQYLPRGLQKAFLLLLILHFTCMAGYGAYIFSDVMQRALVDGEAYALILILVLLLSAYAVCGGIESRARVYEVLFPILFCLLFLLFVIAAFDVEPAYYQGFFTSSLAAVGQGGLSVFFCLTPLFLVLFFPAYVKREHWGGLVRAVRAALLFAMAVLAVLYVLLLGSFGSGALAAMRYPAVILMSSVHLRGSFLKRLDAFMVAVWFFTLFALVTVFLFYAQELAQKLTGVQGRKRHLAVVAAAVFGVAMLLYGQGAAEVFQAYLLYLGVPLFLFLPAVVLAVGTFYGKRRRHEEG